MISRRPCHTHDRDAQAVATNRSFNAKVSVELDWVELSCADRQACVPPAHCSDVLDNSSTAKKGLGTNSTKKCFLPTR